MTKIAKALGVSVDDLILVQLPNLQKGINDLDKDVLTEVERILKRKYDITEDNDKMAIWLAENPGPAGMHKTISVKHDMDECILLS